MHPAITKEASKNCTLQYVSIVIHNHCEDLHTKSALHQLQMYSKYLYARIRPVFRTIIICVYVHVDIEIEISA